MNNREELRQVRFSRHALATMADRDITPEEVAKALTDPHITEPNQGDTRYVRDGLAVVVSPDWVIKTVLLRSVAQWTNADARARRRA